MTASFGEPMGGTFGEGVQSGWGEAEVVSEETGELLPGGGAIDLGNGHKLVLKPEAWRALLHHQAVVDAITQRAQEVADAANEMVALDPRTIERLEAQGNVGPAYDILVQNQPDTTRPRARVQAANFKGILDDAHNSTLYKAMNTAPNPFKKGTGPTTDSVQPTTHEHHGGRTSDVPGGEDQ